MMIPVCESSPAFIPAWYFASGRGAVWAVDPRAEIAPEFIEIVIPVRPEAERIADESTDDAASGVVGVGVHGYLENG
jgi:hypothetical protein